MPFSAVECSIPKPGIAGGAGVAVAFPYARAALEKGQNWHAIHTRTPAPPLHLDSCESLRGLLRLAHDHSKMVNTTPCHNVMAVAGVAHAPITEHRLAERGLRAVVRP